LNGVVCAIAALPCCLDPGKPMISRADAGFRVEPPIGIEPMTYALRVRRSDRLS
jgi:hypothetical protein